MVEWILEAAARVFDQDGIAATTNHIASAAGVSVGSLYQYFPNKFAIIDELALRHLDEVDVAFAAAVADPDDPVDMIERVVAMMVDIHQKRGRFHQAMRAHAGRSPAVQQRFADVMARITNYVSETLAGHGIDDAEGRATILVATVDAHVHGILAVSDPDLRHSRLRLTVQQAFVAAGIDADGLASS